MPRLRLLIMLFGAPLAAACLPVVTHGPEVTPGLSAGGIGAIGTQPILVREIHIGHGNVVPVLPPLAVFARHGWTPEHAGTPVPLSAGVSFPIALPFSLVHPEADLYAQLTPAAYRAGAAGAGVLLSRSYTTPYLQAGRGRDEGISVYTTQSIAFFHGGDRAPDATVWMPALAVKASRFHLLVQAGLGRERMEADSMRPVRFLMAGIVMEAPRMTGRFPGF